MNADQVLAEIHETNLSYLLLAQSLIRRDPDQALYRLGITEDSAKLLNALSPVQVVRLARTNHLLCQFRVDDAVLSLLTSGARGAANEATSSLHAAILVAGQHSQAA